MTKRIDQIKHRPYLTRLCSFSDCSPYKNLPEFPHNILEGGEVLLQHQERGTKFIDHKVCTRYVKADGVLSAEHTQTLIIKGCQDWYQISIERLYSMLKMRENNDFK